MALIPEPDVNFIVFRLDNPYSERLKFEYCVDAEMKARQLSYSCDIAYAVFCCEDDDIMSIVYNGEVYEK